MENSQVVIRIVVHGQKLYITNVQPSSYSFQLSDKPFSDKEILKFNKEHALEYAKQLQRSYPDRLVQVVDINGKTLNQTDNIVNEELKKFLGESYIKGGDDFTFRQRIGNVFFYNYDNFTKDFDTDISESDITITWKISFWLNEMGIENFSIDGEKVEGQFMLQMLDLQTDEVRQETPKNIADFNWKFVVDDDDDYTVLRVNKTLYVQELDFDFKAQTCTLGFKPRRNNDY
jgi:hypothetical protein